MIKRDYYLKQLIRKKDPLLRVFGFMDKSLPKDFIASKYLQN
ncbi:hypothetical protein [Treponema denticola]|nr:hypothetical protein [Treponema denticola]